MRDNSIISALLKYNRPIHSKDLIYYLISCSSLVNYRFICLDLSCNLDLERTTYSFRAPKINNTHFTVFKTSGLWMLYLVIALFFFTSKKLFNKSMFGFDFYFIYHCLLLLPFLNCYFNVVQFLSKDNHRAEVFNISSKNFHSTPEQNYILWTKL